MKPIPQEHKLKELKKLWGYVELTQATISVTGERVWMIKNYRGKLLDRTAGDQKLPGNPRATKMIYHTGHSKREAINRAYYYRKRL